MKLFKRVTGSALFALVLLATATTGFALILEPPSLIDIKWNEGAARLHAREVLRTGKPFVFSTGGYACGPTISEKHRWLIAELPRHGLACGCFVGHDSELLSAQIDYARAFNEEIARGLPQVVRE